MVFVARQNYQRGIFAMGLKLSLHHHQVRFSKLVHQKQLRNVLLLVLLWLVIAKRLDTRSYFIITNFYTELKPQENVNHDMNSPTFTLYTTMGAGREW